MKVRTRRSKVSKSAVPATTEASAPAVPEKEDGVPYVLSWEAVQKGHLPKAGGSGMPESLERDVPPEYRYWKLEKVEERIAVREALVEAQLFTEETVKTVDGELRRVQFDTVVKMFLPPAYDETIEPVIPPKMRPIEKVASYLDSEGAETVLFDSAVVKTVGLVDVLERVKKLEADWVIEVENTPEARSLLKETGGIQLKGRDDLIFSTSAGIKCDDLIEKVTTTEEEDLLQRAFENVPLIKADEERIVFGVVLEPDEVDSQNDTVSPEEIRTACHKFMEVHGNLGLQHKEMINGQVKLLENFIAPVSFEVNGEKVKAGTWLIKERIIDDELWTKVKAGDITGFSIGGSAVRVPVN